MNRAGLAAMAAGLAALVAGVALGVVPAPATPDAGTLRAAPPGPTAAPSTAPPASPPVSFPPSDTEGDTAGPDLAPAPAGGPPQEARIAALGMVAAVDAVTVDRDGRLHVPADPARLGWWIGAARPGDPHGTVLLTGHVDTAEAGRGALFRLQTLPMGATVELVAAGQVFRYRVTARRSYAKTRLPADLFRVDGPPRLALVTCGGRFDNGTYASNVIVYADPLA
jgi:hypothetical protein